MADNKVIGNMGGTPFTAATDEIGGVDYAKTKLFTSEADSAEGIGDTDKGTYRALWTDPRPDIVIPTAPVASSGLTTGATPYAINDVLGAGWTIPNAARASGGTGRVLSVAVMDQGDVVNGLALWFFSQAVTFGTDNVAASISDADALYFQGRVAVSLEDMGGVRLGGVHSMSLSYICNGGTDLKVYATTLAAHNQFAAATDLRLLVGLVRD